VKGRRRGTGNNNSGAVGLITGHSLGAFDTVTNSMRASSTAAAGVRGSELEEKRRKA